MPPAKDVDLRIPPPAILLKSDKIAAPLSPVDVSPAETVPVPKVSPLVQSPSAEVIKKRPSNSSKYEEPAAKKCRSEKIDM